MWSAALDSSDVLLSYSVISLASHITTILISILLQTRKHIHLSADMPDAELPRSSRPNCEVTWDEGGELRALEDISMGTWLAIAPSDEESEGEWEEEEGDNDGEEGKGEGF